MLKFVENCIQAAGFMATFSRKTFLFGINGMKFDRLDPLFKFKCGCYLIKIRLKISDKHTNNDIGQLAQWQQFKMLTTRFTTSSANFRLHSNNIFHWMFRMKYGSVEGNYIWLVEFLNFRWMKVDFMRRNIQKIAVQMTK